MFVNIPLFISKYITGRSESLFKVDIESNYIALDSRIKGKSVLVIGGAGTIGSSFIFAILKFRPSKLFVIDINENGLTELTRDLRSSIHIQVPSDYRTYPISFSHPVFEKIYREEGPFDIVANFAAHKHVRSEKDAYSIHAMLDNNVFQAEKLLNLLTEIPPERFFCVSTDKASNPVNVMGASKKLMEDVILSYSHKLPITTARFANVAFSNGSLLFGYLERFKKRQALSCPSDVKRYFISPEESGQICMLACLLGESGDILFPKFHERDMKYFKDITDNLISFLGLEKVETKDELSAKKLAIEIAEGGEKYPVFYFKTDTSGEKLFEEFYTSRDVVDFERFQNLGVIKNAIRFSPSEMRNRLTEILNITNRSEYNKLDIIKSIKKFIPNFQHIEKGKNLDEKM